MKHISWIHIPLSNQDLNFQTLHAWIVLNGLLVWRNITKNRKYAPLLLFPTFFFIESFIRERKKQLIKPKSIPNIHRCTDEFSKIAHTKQRLRAQARVSVCERHDHILLSAETKKTKVKNRKCNQNERKKVMKNCSAVLINSSLCWIP